MDDIDGGSFQLPSLKEVSDHARREFESFFNDIPGSKEFVIQSKSLMALLEHVTPMRVLRRYIHTYTDVSIVSSYPASHINYEYNSLTVSY